MKRILLFLLLGVFIWACQHKHPTGKEYTAAYVCPMHCEGSGSDQPGKCPKCKMDYVKNESEHDHHDHEGHDHEGHDHDGHGHDGHDHHEGDSHDHGSDTTHQH